MLVKYRKLKINYTHCIEETAVDLCLQCGALLSFELALLSRFNWPNVQQATRRELRSNLLRKGAASREMWEERAREREGGETTQRGRCRVEEAERARKRELERRKRRRRRGNKENPPIALSQQQQQQKRPTAKKPSAALLFNLISAYISSLSDEYNQNRFLVIAYTHTHTSCRLDSKLSSFPFNSGPVHRPLACESPCNSRLLKGFSMFCWVSSVLDFLN